MKLRILLLAVVPFLLLAAQEKKTAGKAQPKAKQGTVEATIPAGAKEIGPYNYRYIDAKGKAWIYRRTPFGVVKMEDKPGERAAEEIPPDMKASEDGDSIRFERPTPFGKTLIWVKKKNDLNETEQAVWDRERKRQAEKAGEAKKADQ